MAWSAHWHLYAAVKRYIADLHLGAYIHCIYGLIQTYNIPLAMWLDVLELRTYYGLSSMTTRALCAL